MCTHFLNGVQCIYISQTHVHIDSLYVYTETTLFKCGVIIELIHMYHTIVRVRFCILINTYLNKVYNKCSTNHQVYTFSHYDKCTKCASVNEVYSKPILLHFISTWVGCLLIYTCARLNLNLNYFLGERALLLQSHVFTCLAEQPFRPSQRGYSSHSFLALLTK